MPKTITTEKIMEYITNLPLNDLLEVARKTAEIVEERGVEEQKKANEAAANLELIKSGGKKQ